jgi:hypothetical protein
MKFEYSITHNNKLTGELITECRYILGRIENLLEIFTARFDLKFETFFRNAL